MDNSAQLNRRNFVKLLGLTSTGILLGCSVNSDKKEWIPNQNQNTFQPNLFIELQKDGKVTIIVSRSEMGQGIRTSLASAIADEMDADWNFVTVKQATGHEKWGNQNTDGSRSVRTLLTPMRKLGASAKWMLLTAAAQQWNLSIDDCKAANHYIINTKTNEKIFFGDLVEAVSKIGIPTDEQITLKKSSAFTFIGKNLKSVDVKDFTHGKAVYGIDVTLPNMKYAAIARCPVTFGTVKSYDDAKAKSISGVEKVIKLDRFVPPTGQFFGALGGVAVIANNTWSAFQGKLSLEIEWDFGSNQNFDSQKFREILKNRVQQSAKVVPGSKGNVNTAFKYASKVIEATYELPFLVHAPMEVPNATAWFQKDKIEVWAPVQDPQTARLELEHFFGIAKENITINVTFLGGGFGRKSKSDFVVEAVALSKEIDAPVQVVWTREDDIKHSFYHACSAQYLRGSLDKNGKVTGWLQRVALPSITSSFKPLSNYASGFELGMGFTNNPYQIDHFRLENAEAESNLRIGWLRSVVNIHSAFGNNCFVDEMANAAKKDPLQMHLDLLKNDVVVKVNEQHTFESARFKNVILEVKKMANWGKKLPENHGIGIAVHYSFYSYVATIVEVSTTENDVKVEKVYTAIDCGLALNKDYVKHQMEGSAIFGISLAFFGEISTTNGAVNQHNFFDYQIARMQHTPKIEVYIIENKDEIPTGVGEPGVPPIAPAICNAIFNANGKRIRKLPIFTTA